MHLFDQIVITIEQSFLLLSYGKAASPLLIHYFLEAGGEKCRPMCFIFWYKCYIVLDIMLDSDQWSLG